MASTQFLIEGCDGPAFTRQSMRQVLTCRTDLDRLQEPGVVPSQLLMKFVWIKMSLTTYRMPYVLMEWDPLLPNSPRTEHPSIDRFVQLMADRDVVLLHVNRESGDLSGTFMKSRNFAMPHKQCDYE